MIFIAWIQKAMICLLIVLFIDEPNRETKQVHLIGQQVDKLIGKEGTPMLLFLLASLFASSNRAEHTHCMQKTPSSNPGISSEKDLA